MLKFLVYAAAASLLGSALGLGVGFQLFPRVIYAAYGIKRDPAPYRPFPADSHAVWVTLAALACTLSAAFFACRQELRSQPSQLMRPKAPKSGNGAAGADSPIVTSPLLFAKGDGAKPVPV